MSLEYLPLDVFQLKVPRQLDTVRSYVPPFYIRGIQLKYTMYYVHECTRYRFGNG